MPPPPSYLPLRWESTGDQWWYASPIDWAAANGHYDLVRELLRLDGNHLIKLTSLRRIRRLETVWDDDEQFHDVARCRSEVARQLLSECEVKKGKNSLIGAGYGGWLLYTAASAGDLSFVQELLQRDPLLVFGEGEYGVTDILYAAARSKSDEVFRVVYDFCAWPRFGGVPGARPGMEEHVGENEIPSAYKAEITNRALHAAARGGNLQLVKEILGDCPEKDTLAFRDVKGATLLHAAAARGQVEVVKDLISSFSSITSSTDNQGNTALHAAAHRGHIAVVEALILASPSSINARNNAGETFLHSVVTGFQTPGFRRLDRHIELMRHLLCGEVFKIEEIMNAKNNDGRTALHLAITGNIHSDLVELLMSVSSIDVNIRDSDGMTPLDIIRQQPQSTSSELLTRQLISAGGIFSSNDYSARKVIASHIKRQSMGNSPGTSFNVSDTEIFLYTGMDNASDDGEPSIHNSPDGQHDPDPKETSNTCRKIERSGSVNSAAQRLKCFLRWPRMKRKSSDQRIKKLVEGSSDGGVIPIPLRQKFSKPSPLPSNKRTLSVPSPTGGNKKLASCVMQGVPTVRIRNRSRSSSFSKLSSSSQSSAGTPKGSQIHEYDHAKPCSSACEGMSGSVGGGKKWIMHGQSGMGKKRLMMNQYLCFGAAASGKHVESPRATTTTTRDLHPPFDVYERSVLSAS